MPKQWVSRVIWHLLEIVFDGGFQPGVKFHDSRGFVCHQVISQVAIAGCQAQRVKAQAAVLLDVLGQAAVEFLHAVKLGSWVEPEFLQQVIRIDKFAHFTLTALCQATQCQISDGSLIAIILAMRLGQHGLGPGKIPAAGHDNTQLPLLSGG